MTVLYFDCLSGAAGDMLLAALLDAGASQSAVREQLDRLQLPGWHLDVEQVTKSGVRATKVRVHADDEAPSRTYADIRSLLESADLKDRVAQLSLGIFRRLADAEGRIHNEDPDRVHFHEVGGIDALIDVVGCAAALEDLGPTEVVSSPMVTGRGWTDSAHGRLPVPAPAVLEILRGVEIQERGDQELITPTGAAVLAAVCERFGPMPALEVSAIGYGAGTKDLAWPNVVRVLVGRAAEREAADGAWLIETNIDDMSPELVPHTIESLLRAGASDAWTSPILMKKGRPAITLSVLVSDENKERALDTLYRETTTFGARIQRVGKDTIDREWIEVTVEGEPIRVKLGRRGGEVVTVSPEYEDAARVARSLGLPLRAVFDEATNRARSALGKPA